jgi:type VI protein secretion system component Hcp
LHGNPYPHLTFNFATKKGAPYFSVTLKDVMVVGIRSWIPYTVQQTSAGLGHMEDVSFLYREILWSDNGSGIQFDFDVLLNNSK